MKFKNFLFKFVFIFSLFLLLPNTLEASEISIFKSYDYDPTRTLVQEFFWAGEDGHQVFSAYGDYDIVYNIYLQPHPGTLWGLCITGPEYTICDSGMSFAQSFETRIALDDSNPLIRYKNTDTVSFIAEYLGPTCFGPSGETFPPPGEPCYFPGGISNIGLSGQGRLVTIDNFSAPSEKSVGESFNVIWETDWSWLEEDSPHLSVSGPAIIDCETIGDVGQISSNGDGSTSCTGTSAGTATFTLCVLGPAQNGTYKEVCQSRNIEITSTYIPPGGGEVPNVDLHFNGSNGPVTINSGDSGTASWTLGGDITMCQAESAPLWTGNK
ncbi:MAG: hypothetical protein V1897_03485, partial [Pseudomonadota bacterium]